MVTLSTTQKRKSCSGISENNCYYLLAFTWRLRVKLKKILTVSIGGGGLGAQLNFANKREGMIKMTKTLLT